MGYKSIVIGLLALVPLATMANEPLTSSNYAIKNYSVGTLESGAHVSSNYEVYYWVSRDDADLRSRGGGGGGSDTPPAIVLGATASSSDAGSVVESVSLGFTAGTCDDFGIVEDVFPDGVAVRVLMSDPADCGLTLTVNRVAHADWYQPAQEGTVLVGEYLYNIAAIDADGAVVPALTDVQVVFTFPDSYDVIGATPYSFEFDSSAWYKLQATTSDQVYSFTIDRPVMIGFWQASPAPEVLPVVAGTSTAVESTAAPCGLKCWWWVLLIPLAWYLYRRYQQHRDTTYTPPVA